MAADLYAGLHELHEPHIVEDIEGVLAFALMHKFLLEAFSKEIVIQQEPILYSTIDCAAELISVLVEYSGAQRPLFTICCECKALKGRAGWLPFEQAIGDISSNALFSHGYCESCVEQFEISDASDAEMTAEGRLESQASAGR